VASCDGTGWRGWVELLEELTDATLDGTGKAVLTELSTVPLPIIDDLG
jgi:hypothetical protein